MFLKSCEISNYRSIKDLKMEFTPSFRILVGLNESGKSNILKALNLLNEGQNPTVDDIRDIKHDEGEVQVSKVRFIFGMENEEINTSYQNICEYFEDSSIKRNIVLANNYEMNLKQFCSARNEGIYNVDIRNNTKIPSYWRIDSEKNEVLIGWKVVPTDWIGYEHFDRDDFKYLHEDDCPELELANQLEDLSIDELNKVIGREVVNRVEEELPACLFWEYSESNLLPDRVNIEEFKSSPEICVPLKNMFLLAGNNDISAAISIAQEKKNGMRNLLNRVSEITSSHLNEVWPEYKHLKFLLVLNGEGIDAVIKDEFNEYSLERRSDGFKRFITFLLMISVLAKTNNLKNTLLLMDEPEIGLHPLGVKYLRNELSKVAKNNNIVVATHSIFMVDRERIDRHVIVKKHEEETSIISEYVSEMLDEEVIYRALGYSFHELLKMKNVILEGWFDKKTIKTWLSSDKCDTTHKMDWTDVGLIHAYGSKDIERVSLHLENYDRKYVIVTDSDEPSLEKQRKFNGRGVWVTYADLGYTDKKTIEDFLSQGYVDQCIENVMNKEIPSCNLDMKNCDIFNEKISRLMSVNSVNKTDSDRIKKLIKNKIFEEISSDHISDLNDLLSVININEKFKP